MNDTEGHLKRQSATSVMVEHGTKIFCLRIIGYMSQMTCGKLTVWGANGRKMKIKPEKGASIEILGHSPDWINKKEDPEILVSSALGYTVEDIPIEVWFEEEED